MIVAEEKARSTYEYLMNLTDDPDVLEPLRFLREREVVHFQRFGEALRYVQEYMDSKRMFIIDKPGFMKPDWGYTKPDCGHTKPDCGHTKPDCGHTKPDCGHTKPDCGHTKPDCGHTKPDCGHTKPDCDKRPNCNRPNGGCIQPRFRNPGIM